MVLQSSPPRKDMWERITHTGNVNEKQESTQFYMLHCQYNLNV